MYAVMLSVTFDDLEAAGRDLRERRLPRVKQLPGFVAGYWVAFDGQKTGRSMMAFESEDDARAAASFIEEGTATDPGETWERVEVGEIYAQG